MLITKNKVLELTKNKVLELAFSGGMHALTRTCTSVHVYDCTRGVCECVGVCACATRAHVHACVCVYTCARVHTCCANT